MTQEQTQALQQFKQALNDYNEDKISFNEYVSITLPLWEKINILFKKDQKSS